MLRNIYRNIFCVFAAFFVFAASFSFSASAADKGEVVIVGACPDFGIEKNGTDYGGLAYEFLSRMSQHTGHRYSFVEGTPEELFEMLLDKKIDVIPCVTGSEWELYKNLLADSDDSVPATLVPFSLSTKFSAVYIYDGENGSNISYKDTAAISKAKIGYLADNQDKYFVDGRFVCGEIEDAEFIMYNTESQMKSDFVSGKLDAVVKECFRTWENETIVYQFGTAESFFLVSGNDRDLASQLASTVCTIYACDPLFASNMYEKYVARYGTQKYAFNSAEKDFISKNPEITLAYNMNADLTEMFDSNANEIIGVTGTMISEIEQYTGLKIKVRACSDLAECVKLLENGEVNAICGGVNKFSLAGYGSFYVGSPYSRVPVVIAGRPNTAKTDHMKIAVPYYGDDITAYMKQLYPTATFLPYNNVKLCMDAVLDGEADILCAGAYEVIYLKNGEYDNIDILGVSSAYHSESIAMSKDSSELFSIFGKALAQMTNNDAVVRTYDTMTSVGYDSLALDRFVEKYFWLIVGVVGLLILCIAVLIVIMALRNKRAAEVDTLTGGRTKSKFLEDSQKLIKKSSPEKWAVVLFDIDKFKYVNDRLGYEEGNRMLERLYKTIGDQLKRDEIYARISDDNFACTVHNAPDNELISKINLIFSEFGRRNSLFVKFPVLFSTGVCRLGQCVQKNGSVDLNAALDRCIIAKKSLKGLHSSSIAFYDGKIREKALREKDYENIIPTALAQHEFQCYLQPKYGLKSRHIEGAEALIRWNSKDFGFICPNDFIPLCEKNGFVVELDFFILEEVCKAMRRWLNAGKEPVVISVNQSRLHLNHDDYIWRLREIVDKYEIPYKYIELELTESVFTENADLLLKIMQKLHEIGFKLSIDDFGSGYSSLNMLKDIPADVVKIDREFFNGTVNSEKGRAVISTVVDLAKNLDMEVISEGVETAEQVEFLTEIDCAMVQGYYFAKPMPMKAFEELWFKDLELIRKEQEEAADNGSEADQKQ